MIDTDKNLAMARELALQVEQRNGRAYFVGGFVRDRLLGKSTKDIDIEVHGLRPAELEEILDGLGGRLAMGESFGVYGLRGYDLDIAMPRKETLRGHGHKDFDISVDPFAGTASAAMRRDFTVNALMEDVLTGEIIDHFGGQADLKNRIIRHVCDTSFGEDPLRVLRGAQFAARLQFTVAEETVEICKGMDLSSLSRERVEQELKKALLQAERPSVFFETLRRMEQLDTWFPEVAALIGVPQPPQHHGEGDVWNHTMMVLDAAAKYRSRVDNPFGFMLGAVTHDFGKAVCTEVIDGVIHAYGHERAGLDIAKTFLTRLTRETKLISYVLNLVELHMKPNVAAGAGSSVKSTNKLFDSAIDPEALISIALADSEGRISPADDSGNEAFLRGRLEIYREYMERPFVGGKDLIDAGLKPGREFSQILDYAHKLRLAGVEKESAMKQCLSYARKLK